ncbi:MAG TPA: MaoC family dehydratase [Stellaceae bacterium]|nr:MaoC family dehydratase [Stellaceae bacterium]
MLYLEDHVVGATDRFGRYEVGRDEILDFARKYDPQPFHLSDEGAAENPLFGRLSASGWHTAAMTMAMVVRGFEERGQPAMLGAAGIDELRWLKPVFAGDVLTLQTEIVDVTRSRRKPWMGTVRTRITVFNQNEEPVMHFTSIVLMRARSEPDPAMVPESK